MKRLKLFLSFAVVALGAMGAGEPVVCASAARWYDFSDPAYYTVDENGNVLTAVDRTGKANASVKTANCYGRIVTFDGLPALDLGAVGSNIDYAFSQIGSNHTLFFVEALEASPGVFLIGSNASADFARGPNGEYANESLGNIGRAVVGVYDNGVRVDAAHTVVPAGRRLVSVRYLKGVASGTVANFGTDRTSKIAGTETTCSGGKKVCEILVFANELTFAECTEVERYLAEKWSIPPTVTASGALLASALPQYRTVSRGDVTFTAGTSLGLDRLDAATPPFTVSGTLAFGSGLTQLPVTVDAGSLTATGIYPLLSWGNLAEGVSVDDFPVAVTNLNDAFAYEIVREANRLALKVVVADGWVYYDVGAGALTCESGKKYYLYGSGDQPVTVPANATVHLRFCNCSIVNPANSAPVVIGAGAKVTMDNIGTTTLSAATANTKSGIELANSAGTRLHLVAGSGAMTIAANGGSTSAYGGCGISVPELAEFEMDATNTTITATGGYKAPGVGSRTTVPSGRIIINAGTLVAQCSGQTACIGTGCQDYQNGATCTYVKITGGTVTANNTSGYGAAIGTGGPYQANSGRLEYFEMTGGTLNAIGNGGAAIGSGPCFSGKTSGSVGTVKISGGTLNLTANNHDWATPAVIGTGGERGNGAGGSGAFESIEISGGAVNIKGDYSSGIGAGWGNKRNVKSATNQGVVRITGGLINISLTHQRWAIGGPEEAEAANKNLARIEITGGNLYANAPMQIQPVNGEANGDRPVYDANVGATWATVTGLVSHLDYPYSVEYAPGGTTTANGDGFAHLWLPAGAYPYGDGKTEYDVSSAAEPVLHAMQEKNIRLCKASQNAILTSGGVETARDIRVNGATPSVGVTLSNCVIKATCPFNCDGTNTTCRVTVRGENTLTGTVASGTPVAATLNIPETDALVLDGDGTLTVNGGYKSGAIGAAGSKNCGDITINGGTITANGGGQAAGIGCGVEDGKNAGTCGLVTINGGTVTATGSVGNWYAAGIGGGTSWNGAGGNLKGYVQTGGTVFAFGAGAAAIGGGSGGASSAANGGWCGPVKISGGVLVADSQTHAPQLDVAGAAIGGGGNRHTGGKAGYLVSYEQTGGTVTAKGYRIGIGGGGRAVGKDTQNFLPYNTTVTISGGTLEATGLTWSIGGQETGETINLKSVEITGGAVKVPNGIQVVPTAANGERAWLGTIRGSAFPKPYDILFTYKDGLTYAYAGNGFAGDEFLSFYLPNGRFKSANGISWEMHDGVLTRVGFVIFVR